jgi:hypothetical protein
VHAKDLKVRVRCAISALRIIGPSFDETVSSERYTRFILTTSIDHLTEDEKTCGHFMQDNPATHAANNSMNAFAVS